MKWLNGIGIFIIFFLVLAPILFMLIFSFSDNRFIVFPVESYSVKWYSSILKKPVLVSSLGVTVVSSFIVSVLSVCLGFMSGYWLMHANTINKPLFLAIFSVPAIIPFILYALGFLEFARHIGFERTTFAIIIGHSVIFSPLATVYFYHQISKLNGDIEHSARELGAPSYKVMTEIVAGQLRKSIFVCMAVIFALSWDEYIVSWFVSGFQKTYAVQVRNMLESTFSPEVFAIGSLIALFSLILLSIAFRFSKKELIV